MYQTSQVHHPTGHCLDTSLPTTPQSHRCVQNRLTDINCCHCNHTMGLLSHPAQNLDVPAGGDHWTYFVLYTRRRSFLLYNTNLHHDPAALDLEQTNLSSELPQFFQTAEELGTPMERRTDNTFGVRHSRLGIDLERE